MMGSKGKTIAAALGALAVLACATALPYQAIRAEDAKRLEVPVARPIATGQPEEAMLENPLVLALYRRGQFLRNKNSGMIYFTPDETREVPPWENTLAQLRQSKLLPPAFHNVLEREPDLSSVSWDNADFWRMSSMRAEEELTGWYVVCEPQSGKAISVSVYLDGAPEPPDPDACLDAWRSYLGFQNMPGWQREQKPAQYLTIYTDTCPDAQLVLTVAWEVTDTWSSLTLSANAQASSTKQEESS